MAGGTGKSATSTPSESTSSGKKPSGSQSLKSQKSILGFFQAKPAPSQEKTQGTPPLPTAAPVKKSSHRARSTQGLTPAPSSDGPGIDEEDVSQNLPAALAGLPSPIDSANGDVNGQTDGDNGIMTASGTPTRKVSPR